MILLIQRVGGRFVLDLLLTFIRETHVSVNKLKFWEMNVYKMHRDYDTLVVCATQMTSHAFAFYVVDKNNNNKL